MEEVEAIQGLLWKYKKGVTGGNWKKNWVFANNRYLLQYAGKTRPSRNEEPKYALQMSDCAVRKTDVRKFAFEVFDRRSKQSFLFAADDRLSFQKWIQVLAHKAARTDSFSAAGVAAGENEDEQQSLFEDFSQSHLSEETPFFLGHSRSTSAAALRASRTTLSPVEEEKSLSAMEEKLHGTENDERDGVSVVFDKVSRQINGHRVVTWSEAKAVIVALDASLCAERVIEMFKHQFPSLADDQYISREHFLRFYKENSMVLSPAYADDVEDALIVNDVRTIKQQRFDWSQLFLGQEQRFSPSLTALLLRISVPQTENVHALVPSEEKEMSAYINYERLHALQDDLQVQFNRLMSGDANANEKLLSTVFRIAEVHAAFKAIATKGAKMLVDELSLPHSLKSLKPVVLDSEVVIYELDGVHLRCLIPPVRESDADISAEREKAVVAEEDVLSKMAGNQWKGLHFVNTTWDRLAADALLKKRYFESVLNKPSSTADAASSVASLTSSLLRAREDDPVANTLLALEFAEKFKLRPKLFTIVDYAGFRVVAYLPHNVLTTQSKCRVEDLNMFARGEYQEDEETLTVNRAQREQSEKTFFRAVANALHVRGVLQHSQMTHWETQTASSPPLTPHNSTSQRGRKAYTGLQHKALFSSTGARTNAFRSGKAGAEIFRGFLQTRLPLPADLPRPSTHDALTKALRGEFVAIHHALFGAEHALLSTDSLLAARKEREPTAMDEETQRSNENEHSEEYSKQHEEYEDDAEEDEEEDGDILDGVSLSQEQWLSGTIYFYQDHLPEFVTRLDAFHFLPFDSFSLCELLHSQGLNLRHLGSVFALSRSHLVKQMVFCEILSRSVKHFVRHALKLHARKCQAMAMQAEERGRSARRDFLDLMEESKIERERIVLQVFNFLFPKDDKDQRSNERYSSGNSKASVLSSWEKEREDFLLVVSDIMYRKFGLFVKREDPMFASFSLRPLHLFLSLQVHLQCRFKEEVCSRIAMNALQSSQTFTAIDVIDFCLPVCKSSMDVLLEQSNLFPGSFQRLLSLRHQFASAGLAREACSLHEIVYLLVNKILCSPNRSTTSLSWREIFEIARCTYDFALSLLQCKDYARCSQVIRSYLADPHTSQMHPYTARLLVLLLISEYRRGCHEVALQSYESSVEIFQRTLPSGHPLCALPMTVLADLYLSVSVSLGPAQDTASLSLESPAAPAQRGVHAARVLLEMAVAIWNQNVPYITADERDGDAEAHSQRMFEREMIGVKKVFTMSTHLGCALQLKLGMLSVNCGCWERAVTLLSQCLIALDEFVSITSDARSSVMLRRDLVVCLFNLAWAHYHFLDEDESLNRRRNEDDRHSDAGYRLEEEHHSFAVLYGQRCLSLWEQLLEDEQDGLRAQEDGDVHAKLSLQLVLYDIFSMRNEFDLALEMLQSAWSSLRLALDLEQCRANNSKGVAAVLVVLGQVAAKSVELAFAALPMPARSLIESVSGEWHANLSRLQQEAHLVDKTDIPGGSEVWQSLAHCSDEWQRASALLVDIMWRGLVVDYLGQLVLEIQLLFAEEDVSNFTVTTDRSNTEEYKTKTKTSDAKAFTYTSQSATALLLDHNSKRQSMKECVASLPLHAQAAVVYLIVQDPIEFAKLMIQ